MRNTVSNAMFDITKFACISPVRCTVSCHYQSLLSPRGNEERDSRCIEKVEVEGHVKYEISLANQRYHQDSI